MINFWNVTTFLLPSFCQYFIFSLIFYIGDNVTNKAFFSWSDAKINGLLNASDLFHNFVSKYNLEKQLELDSCLTDDNINVEYMDVDDKCVSSGCGNLTLTSLQTSNLPEQIVVAQYDQNKFITIFKYLFNR